MTCRICLGLIRGYFDRLTPFEIFWIYHQFQNHLILITVCSKIFHRLFLMVLSQKNNFCCKKIVFWLANSNKRFTFLFHWRVDSLCESCRLAKRVGGRGPSSAVAIWEQSGTKLKRKFKGNSKKSHDARFKTSIL